MNMAFHPGIAQRYREYALRHFTVEGKYTKPEADINRAVQWARFELEQTMHIDSPPPFGFQDWNDVPLMHVRGISRDELVEALRIWHSIIMYASIIREKLALPAIAFKKWVTIPLPPGFDSGAPEELSEATGSPPGTAASSGATGSTPGIATSSGATGS